jgi:hypothetical protein
VTSRDKDPLARGCWWRGKFLFFFSPCDREHEAAGSAEFLKTLISRLACTSRRFQRRLCGRRCCRAYLRALSRCALPSTDASGRKAVESSNCRALAIQGVWGDSEQKCPYGVPSLPLSRFSNKHVTCHRACRMEVQPSWILPDRSSDAAFVSRG